jgi:glycosyltransferase involved in cell wall biosynthesis
MSRWATGKIDFHLHSYASNVTDYYAANTFAIPESYSDPIETYHALKRQGMTLVTLTDHNSIDGVLEMLAAGLPDVFISAEMTASFPEDGCNIHVTVANMTEAQFAEINRLRRNLYEMLAYCDAQIAAEDSAAAGNKLAYFMTHPLMSTQNRPYGREGSLSLEHIEKALLLFECLEVRNGTRTRSLNELTVRLIESLDRERILRLAEKHKLAPHGTTPWLKAFVAGSDDHSGINPGRTWTEFTFPKDRAPRANDVIESIRRRETRPDGAHGGPVTLAHAMVKLLYDGAKPRHRAEQKKGVSIGGPINSLLGFVFESNRTPLHRKLAFGARTWFHTVFAHRATRLRGTDHPFEKLLGAEAHALLADAEFRRTLAAATRTDERIFAVVSALVNRIFARYVERIRRANSKNLICVIKEVVALVSSNLFVSLPYFLSYFHQSSDRQIVRDVRKAFRIAERNRLVLVTDTFFEINGVSRSIRRMIDESTRRDLDFTVVTCLSAREREEALRQPEIAELVASGKLRIFASIVDLDLPEYEGLKLRLPPFLELLKYLQESGFTKMQISTPGTIGLAALLAAKLLQIETSSTYHTSFPEYVENYTQDISLEALTWKYMILFYHSVDEVVVPSQFIARLLHDRGLRNRKLLILDRWVDLRRFDPAKRVVGYWRRYGIGNETDVVKFVYVGRVGVEKNLATLAEAFRDICATRDDVHLIVIGDGPYRATLETALAGLPVTFTGFLEGEELSCAMASADVKVFPSTTDTWGNAPLEAQASGLPVIVSDKGGPQELMQHGRTGFRVAGRDVAALRHAMLALMDPATRERMGREARAFTEANRIEEPFSAILDSESYRRRIRARRKGEDAHEEERSTALALDFLDAEPTAVAQPADPAASHVAPDRPALPLFRT